MPISVGDCLTQGISQIQGAPPFSMAWTPEKRKAAKEKVAAWVVDDRRDWLAVAKASPFFTEGN